MAVLPTHFATAPRFEVIETEVKFCWQILERLFQKHTSKPVIFRTEHSMIVSVKKYLAGMIDYGDGGSIKQCI
jgi:hypothetical protein